MREFYVDSFDYNVTIIEDVIEIELLYSFRPENAAEEIEETDSYTIYYNPNTKYIYKILMRLDSVFQDSVDIEVYDDETKETLPLNEFVALLAEV